MRLAAETYTSSQGEQVCILLQIHASIAEAKTLEQECENVVRHALLETEGDAEQRLDGTLKEMNGLFKGLLLSRQIEDVHAIIAIVDSDQVLHVSHAGRAEAYVVRGGMASQITEYSRGKPTPAFVHIASGTLEPRDTILFSTQRLLRTFTPAQLAQLTQRGSAVLEEVTHGLESEREAAALAVLHVAGAPTSRRAATREESSLRKGSGGLSRAKAMSGSMFGRARSLLGSLDISAVVANVQDAINEFLRGLKDPKRKRKTHLLMVAGILAVFLVLWAGVNLSTLSQRSKSRAELEALITEIEGDLQTAENRALTRDLDSANAILTRAEERAKQVLDNDDRLFRTEANDLLARIRQKQEEVNNVIRPPLRVVVNLTAKKEDVSALGLMGIADGEFVAYDRQDAYRIVLNSLDDPDRIADEDLILHGNYFERYNLPVFQTNGNSIVELTDGQPVSMKTEDPAGWITGKDIESYLRYLYVLSPENNQIYKYERFANKYSAPTQYNVNGDLKAAIDIVIDGYVYVLSDGGAVSRLFRGEVKPFTIRGLPTGALANVKKLFKVPDGNLYLLDPVGRKVIVVTDGGATGESTYLRQFVLEGETTELKDLYVDSDQTHLYVLDEKRLYVVDLQTTSAPKPAQ